MSFYYTFPALRGRQAKREYYVVMCPLRLIPRLFLFDEEEIPAQYRAQRILNKSRIPVLTSYIVDNQDNYVFSSITASIDGESTFIPHINEPASDIGELQISMDARFLINDGQHRRAAIEEALKMAPELADESISVVFYRDKDLKQAQQIFSDLNRHSINTTSSIGILYDQRDEIALLTKMIVEENPFFRKYVDNERVSLSKNSPKVLALNHLFNANLKILGKVKGDAITEEETDFIRAYWEEIISAILEWQFVDQKEMNPRELRENYIVGHGLFVESIGCLGNTLHKEYADEWQRYVKKLKTIDWSRSNKEHWLGRAFNKTGRIQKSNVTVGLTVNKIKNLLDIPLSKQEEALEEKHMAGVEE